MFEMTECQFLRKSQKTITDTTYVVLSLLKSFSKNLKDLSERENEIENLNILKKNIESIFFDYEKITPPGQYKKLYMSILRMLISLDELVASRQEELKKGVLITNLKEFEKTREKFRKLKSEVKKELKLKCGKRVK
ncbi:hypothetical protein Mfer_0310 [Methanothermus fervidus DSM 2088]|uniref:Uncharacterized protein n=1 Tax=Methanothermus fervidus (strain ATCC 43054 / DSM 2088 / JCM 10308 / V24 S) TaxID=523846 RepID=E3GXT1_METFV|nr:hypothetical protein [Methanothermus fervidus]ADP77113.1 hypothetical protein Mfer_0310 [Methanothermus fervidus DSM 2088]